MAEKYGDVSIHAARVTAKAPWAKWDDEISSVILTDDLIIGGIQFGNMKTCQL